MGASTPTAPDTDGDGPEVDSYDWLTIMQGPDVSGKGRIHFGVHDTWEKLDEDFNCYVAAEPIEYITLPWPMTRPEIEDYLNQGGRGEDLLDTFDGDDQGS